MDVKGIDRILPRGIEQKGQGPASVGKPDFGTVLRESLGEVNQLQAKADEAVEALATGKGISLHETMVALEKADLSFRLMMEVRNKIVQAYREVLSMNI